MAWRHHKSALPRAILRLCWHSVNQSAPQIGQLGQQAAADADRVTQHIFWLGIVALDPDFPGGLGGRGPALPRDGEQARQRRAGISRAKIISRRVVTPGFQFTNNLQVL